MHIGIGIGITTLRSRGLTALSVPGTMTAPGLAQINQTRLSVTRAAAPADGGSPILSYDLRHSVDQISWTVVTGIGVSQTITGLTAGTVYFVQTRAVNAVGAAPWSASASQATVAATPVNSVLPVISGTATVGLSLSVSNGTWTGSPTGFAYQWKRAGGAIGGAVASTYLLAPADAGTTITCTVTATNASGSAAADSNTVGPITSAAVAPNAMAAPAVTPNTRTGFTATRAAAPFDGGSAITSYDMRYSTDQATWTTVSGISAAQAQTGLLDGTVYYVQTRAVNAVGPCLTWSPSGLIATFASVTSINAEGWSATVTAPPTFDPVNTPQPVVVSRQGFDTTAAAVTYLDAFTLTQRVRQAYPNQATLDTSRCALTDYVYSTDTVTGVTNNSAEVSPKPIANWVLSDHTVVGNIIRLELVAFHRNGRNREQVACVEFRATDGTTTVTQKVAVSVISGRAGDANPIIVYQCDLDVSTLANPATITVNAKVYPFIGGAASVADSAASAVEREFSPRIYLRNTTLAANPVFVYVATTGNDTTGAVSTTAATAAAAPCLTVLGAINRLIAVNATLDGCIIRVGAGSFVMASTATTRTQTVGECIITRDPAVAKSASIVTFGLAAFRTRFGAAGGWLRFFDITVQRTGASTIQGEATSALHLTFDQCAFDNGANSATIYANSHGYWLGTVLTNLATGALTAGTYEHRLWRGTSMTLAAQTVESWLAIGNAWTGLDGTSAGTRTQTGGIMAFNKLMKVGSNAGAWTVGATTDCIGAAFVQNVVEYTSATSSPAIRSSADATSGNTQHILIQSNSFAGFFINGRANIFYDEGATRRSNKLMAVRGNIHVQINTKGDQFRGVNEAGADASSAVGNWAYLYGVGCEAEFSMFIDANSSGIGSAFAQAYPGLAANIGTSATLRNDPLYTANAATTSGPTAGAGNGSYTLQAGSPAKGMVARPALRFDLSGAARSATAASAGAYE